MKKIAFTPTYDNLAFAGETFEILEEIRVESQSWESQEFARSNTRLYKLLSDVFHVYQVNFLDASPEDRRTLREQLDSTLKTAGIANRKGKDALSLLLRYVFNADRRRIFTYKYALSVAHQEGVSYKNLPEWLSQKGGVEEVSRQFSPSQEALDRQEAVTHAINQVQETIAGRAGAPLATVQLPGKASGKRAVLIADCDATGEYKILYAISEPTEGILKNLILLAAKTTAQKNSEDKVNDAEVKNFTNPSQAQNSSFRLAA